MRKIFSILLAGVIVLSGCGIATAAMDFDYEESNFSWSPASQHNVVVADENASGGSAMKLTKNVVGTVTGPSDPIIEIRVRARGENCSNGWPNMRISLGDNIIGNQVVDQVGWTEYVFLVNESNSDQVKVEFTNEHWAWWFTSLICTRNLFIDKVIVTTDTEPTTTTTITTTTTTTTAPPTNTINYVAMGDSYSSGWGANRSPAGVDPNVTYEDCGRSSNSAQILLAGQRNWELNNVACGGTSTRHILTESYQGEPPQIQAIDSETDVVTMTIGGNDTSLIWILDQCVRGASFLCWGGINGASMQNQFNDKLVAFGPKMDDVLRQAVSQAAPGVKIRAAGYPYIVRPENEPIGACTWMTSAEQSAFAEMHRKTNDAIRDATQRISVETGADIAYVDPLAAGSPFMQRDVNGQLLDSCSTSTDRYMNNITEVTLANGGWHPNILGQQYYRDLYAGTL